MKYTAFLLFLVIGFCQNQKSIAKEEFKSSNYDAVSEQALKYCVKNNLQKNYYMLVDLNVHSGKKRFYIYDFNKDSIVKSYMVSHGCGDNKWSSTFTKDNPKISNEFDSHCSSVGKYIIGERGSSQWGIRVKYLLKGKDKTNSNALERAIVLHSWEEIPDDEVYPKGTPEGWGCPAVSNAAMKEIDAKLKKSVKPVLLWVIKS
ncbi:MAG TPA: murein L,D-transpeptidase catalytic domain family protein [Flavobacterium sp.]|nr:murein L,D-transpeptidase catalytic domain family protein [Flavobacterium sp.]